MQRFPRWKYGLILAVLAISIAAALPNVAQVPSWWPFQKPLHLGLDLKGGVHLVLDVDVDKAVAHARDEAIAEARRVLRKAGIRYRRIAAEGDDAIAITLKRPEQTDEALDRLQEELGGEFKVGGGKGFIRLVMRPAHAEEVRNFAVEQAIEVVRGRVDALGTTEPVIARQGKRRIVVQIPGYEDTARAKRILGKTAQLEFHLVDEPMEEKLDKALREGPPPDDVILYGPRPERRPYLVKRRAALTGAEVAEARVGIDSRTGEYAVVLKFNRKGARKFDRLTRDHVGERFAIVLEGVVRSAPVIRERIAGGVAQITGGFTRTEAHDLAIVLRAGALPAPVKVVEERTVGPSLGRDSIAAGIRAIIAGGLIVLAFMAFYYRGFGLVADLALIFNLVILVAVMSMLGATLTLPGIAGIVLTVGMAVDANVLIFERIREELRLGKTPLAAVDGGFEKAFSTIVDANLTTLIAAIVLFQFGTGPVKGFAVTLSIGILASMFTALTFTRGVLALFLERRRVAALSI